MSKNRLMIILFLIILPILIFWQFFAKNLYLFPGNYLLAWYEPWKSDHMVGQTIIISHKPVADDALRYLYPFKILSMDVLRRLELPLWNPYNGSGTPLLATFQSGFFNPFNILFLFLPNYLAWTIYIIIQAILLSLFTYIYCRKIKISKKGSILSTVVFLFSGFVIARLVYSNIIFPLTMLPLILYLIEDFLNNPKSKKIFFLPLAIAFLFLSGHPHIVFYVLIFSSIYLVYKFLKVKKQKSIKNLSLFIILLGCGLCLAAIQIIPALELFKNANINPQSSKFIFERFLLPPTHLVTLLIPNYFGNQATYNYWGAGDYIETIASVGIIPCFLSFIAVFGNKPFKKDVQMFFIASTIITVLLTLNWFLPKFIFTLPIPIFSTGVPSRIFVLTTFSLSILAGYGFDNWLKLKTISKHTIYSVIFFTIAIATMAIITLLLFLLQYPCPKEVTQCRIVALRNTILEIVIFSVYLVLFFTYILSKKNYLKNALPRITILILVILGLYNSNKFLPFSTKETFLPINPLIETLKKDTLDGRVFGMGSANIRTNLATHFRVFDPNYFDPLFNKRYAQLIGYANTGVFPPQLKRSDIEIVQDINVDENLNQRRHRLFNLIGIKYLIYKKSEIYRDNLKQKSLWEDNKWVIKINEEALPKAYIVNDFEVISGQEKILQRLFSSSFDYRKRVILEDKPKFLMGGEGLLLENKVSIIKYKENNLSIQADINSNSLLVLADNYYPGWKAFVDGKEAKIYRSNYSLRAIQVPKGEHKIEFIYDPTSIKIGAVVSFLSLLILFTLFVKRKNLLS